MSTSNPLTIKVLQFFGGFFGWFLFAASTYLLLLLPMGCLQRGYEQALGCAYLFIAGDGLTILLTIAVTIYFFRRRKLVATGILTAVVVNLVIQIFMQQGFDIFMLGIPFFVTLL